MDTVGIICEYNPLHSGHKKQLDALRLKNPGAGIVCLMSGNYVQRGAPAVLDKSLRAEAAVLSGADLVLEMPVCASLSSAEGFAAKSVEILSGLCDTLSFGAETECSEGFLKTAQLLLSAEFSKALAPQLEKGLSFPAARQAALEAVGGDPEMIGKPNNILAVEYCKAILQQSSPLEIAPIHRKGGYHDLIPDEENPSATALRALMEAGEGWLSYVPEEARDVLSRGEIHTLQAGENAILSRLRTMTDEEFSQLPFGSEGLWRKLMHCAREYATLTDILEHTKSKRYTRTRLDRMVLCAFLGITEEMLRWPTPYVRILAFNDRGRGILKNAQSPIPLVNAGQRMEDPMQDWEARWGRQYGLFAQTPEAPDAESVRRVRYIKKIDY